MKKSRYQMTNRGRKGAPVWYVEDFKGVENNSVGRYIASYRLKYLAEGMISNLRANEEK